MCAPASFILTKSGMVFWSKVHDQHGLIISENGLHDSGCRGANIVKIEITPPIDGRDPRQLDNWDYKIDDTEIPSWYDANAGEALCRTELAKWSRYHIVKSGRHIVNGNRSIVIVGGSRVTLVVSGGVVRTCGNSQPKIEAVSGGVVRTCGNSQPKIEAVSGGEVWTCGNSQPKIEAVSGGDVWTYDNSQPKIEAVSGGEVWTCDNSQPKIGKDTRI